MALRGRLVAEPGHLVVLGPEGRRLEVDLLAVLQLLELLLSHHDVSQREVRGRYGARGGGEAGGGNSWGETPGPDGLVSPPSDQDLNITW